MSDIVKPLTGTQFYFMGPYRKVCDSTSLLDKYCVTPQLTVAVQDVKFAEIRVYEQCFLIDISDNLYSREVQLPSFRLAQLDIL